MYKKFLVLLVVVFGLLSCEENKLPTETYNENRTYTIEEVQSYKNGLYLYLAKRDRDEFFWEYKFTFADSLGKFLVGDEIMIQINKKN